MAAEYGQVSLAQVLDIDEPVARPVDGGDDFVELQLHGAGLLVLGPLDEKHHEEGDDRGTRVDDELPGVGVSERGTRQDPDSDRAASCGEGGRAAGPIRGRRREPLEQGNFFGFSIASIDCRSNSRSRTCSMALALLKNWAGFYGRLEPSLKGTPPRDRETDSFGVPPHPLPACGGYSPRIPALTGRGSPPFCGGVGRPPPRGCRRSGRPLSSGRRVSKRRFRTCIAHRERSSLIPRLPRGRSRREGRRSARAWSSARRNRPSDSWKRRSPFHSPRERFP